MVAAGVHGADHGEIEVVTEPEEAKARHGGQAGPAVEFVEVAGGHATGFKRCGGLLPPAVLRALARVELRSAL